MKTLEPNELRILNKILQLMKSDHGVAISPKAEKLPELLLATVSVVNDPVINAIWAPIATALSVEGNPSSTHNAAHSATKEAIGNGKESEKKGRYTVYRGKKTWIED